MPSATNATKALHAIGFMGLLVIIASALDAGIGVAARRDLKSKANWVFEMKGGTYDYVVLGSSRAYRVVQVAAVDSGVRGRGLNLGQDGASIPEIALMFDVFLRRNSTRRVLLEVDEFGLDSVWVSHPLHEYLYIAHLQDTAVAHMLHDYFGARELLWHYVPLIGYAEYNDRVGIQSVMRVLRRQHAEYDSTGSAPPHYGVSAAAFDSARDTTYLVSESWVKDLERLLATARTRRIPVTMFTATEYAPFRDAVRNRTALFDRYRAIGREYGAAFVEVADSDIAADRANFQDPRHLNARGAAIFSHRLGEALRREWGPFTPAGRSP